MSKNRDLLKEAVADAKAVKAMAIANAKAALEESFTPQLKSMLSAKLQEMEEEEIDEAGFGPMINVKGHGNIEDESSLYEEEMDEDLDLNELLGELNEEEEMESEEEEMESEEEGEPLDLEDMTDEDLKKMIEDVIADMIASGELEAGEEGEEGDEMEDMEADEVEDEEVDLDELLAEIESLDEEDEDMMYEEDEEALKEDVTSFFLDADGVASTAQAIAAMATAAGGVGLGFLASWWKSKAKEGKPVSKSEIEAATKKADSMAPAAGLDESTELEEAYATIETLRQDLNEVNLLNAKLLYTNKIFKAKNLTESQKVKVLTSFDKAATVKETKLVYETLIEGLKEKRNPIKESLGMASKVVGSTTTKQPIVESNDMVSRFQKLAGII